MRPLSSCIGWERTGDTQRRPWRQSPSLITTAKLAVIPGGDALLDELERDALRRLGSDRLEEIRTATAVALEQRRAEPRHLLEAAVDHGLRLDHHSAQLVVLDASLDLKGGARVALEIAHLLGFRVGPH